ETRVLRAIEIAVVQILNKRNSINRVPVARNRKFNRSIRRRPKDGDIVCLRVDSIDVQARTWGKVDLAPNDLDADAVDLIRLPKVRYRVVQRVDQSDSIYKTLRPESRKSSYGGRGCRLPCTNEHPLQDSTTVNNDLTNRSRAGEVGVRYGCARYPPRVWEEFGTVVYDPRSRCCDRNVRGEHVITRRADILPPIDARTLRHSICPANLVDEWRYIVRRWGSCLSSGGTTREGGEVRNVPTQILAESYTVNRTRSRSLYPRLAESHNQESIRPVKTAEVYLHGVGTRRRETHGRGIAPHVPLITAQD